jgi:uncharacterized protein (TIGR02246 family)
MMARYLGLLLTNSLILLLAVTSCSKTSNAPDSQAKAEAEITEVERQWAETAVTGDISVIERILADDFLGTSPEGKQYTKQDFIKDMKTHPASFTSNHVNEVKVRLFDDVAVAQGNETFTRTNGEKGRFVWTDVLRKRDGKWQVIAAEDLIAPVGADQASSSGGLFLNSSEREKYKTEVGKTRDAYMSAWKSANAGQIADLYTDDALVLYPNQPAVNGKSAIRAYFQSFFGDFAQKEFVLESSEVEIAGDWAFDRGTYRWKGVPRAGAGGDPAEDHGKYLVILRRQPDGTWKVARDMDNSDRPAFQATREGD